MLLTQLLVSAELQSALKKENSSARVIGALHNHPASIINVGDSGPTPSGVICPWWSKWQLPSSNESHRALLPERPRWGQLLNQGPQSIVSKE